MIDWLQQRLREDEEVRVMISMDQDSPESVHGVLVSVDKRGVIVQVTNLRRKKEIAHVLLQWKNIKSITVTSEVGNE